MKTKSFKQTISLPGTPRQVYEILMDSKRHAECTGEPARISRNVGGSFSVYSGYATGRNLELIPDTKIVQTWHASDWDDEAYSTVTFLISPAKTGSSLMFSQTGIPQDKFSAVKQGWKDFYWTPMRLMLQNVQK